MAFVVDALAVADQQDLRRFVVDLEGLGDFVGQGPEAKQIEVVKEDGVGCCGPVEAVFCH